MSDPFFRPWIDKEKVEAAEPPLAERQINEQQQQQQREQNRLMIDPSGSQQRAPIEQAMVENGNSENKFASKENNQNTINTPEPPPAHTSQTTSKTAHETVSTSAASATVKNENGDIKLASKENTENNINTPKPPPAHTSQKTSKTAHETMSTSETSASLIPLSLVLKRPYFTSPNHLNEPQVVVVTLPLQRTTAHSGCTKSLKKKIVPTMSSPLEAASATVQTKSGEGLGTKSLPQPQSNKATKNQLKRPLVTPTASVTTLPKKQKIVDGNTLSFQHCFEVSVNKAQPQIPQYVKPSPQHVKPSPQHVKPSPQHVKPSPQHVKPSPQCVKPSQQCVKPSPQCVKPSPQCVKPSPQCVKPSPKHVKPSPQCVKPSPQHVEPSPQCVKPSPQCVKPSPQCVKPSPQYTQPSPPQYMQPYIPVGMSPYTMPFYSLSTAGQYFSIPTSSQGFTTFGGHPNYSFPQPRTDITNEEQNWLKVPNQSQPRL
ncbi:pollen-specific leucine-rich repeat extensin-like protein 2 [Ceratitis capitata]|uniref:pollen-specific leucine-rich repeat extensin-like protein 2 n=1 Tax=Ceratitis capitata TaxID=7213 RepID=UPI000A10E900|nr:pollen-specific leucine-rich repeat extensin-like protein 2 [Ceratitis capitata]